MNNTMIETEILNAYRIHEHADELEQTISRCDCLTDTLEECLERIYEMRSQPSDDRQFITVVNIIQDYSADAKIKIRQLQTEIFDLYVRLRSLSEKPE